MNINFRLKVTFLLLFSVIRTYDGHSNNLNKSNQHLNVSYGDIDACSRTTKTRNILFAGFALSVLIIGVTGNAVSIIVILISRTLRSQGTYHLVLSLAIADMGVSLFVTTIKVDMYFHNGSFCHDINACYFLTFVDYLFPMASVIHLLIIAVDRSIAIGIPYFYASNFTKTITKFLILVVWVYAIFWSSLGMFPWHSTSYDIQIMSIGEQRICFVYDIYYSTTIAAVVYFIPMAITTCLYTIVFKIATKQAALIESTLLTKKNNIARRFRRDMKAIKTVTLVFAAYFICWAPHFVIILINCWSERMISFAEENHAVYDAVTTVFNNVLPTLNSCINPFIYFISSNHFRVAIKDGIYKLLRKPRDGILYPDSYDINKKRLLHDGTIRKTVKLP